MKELLNDLSLTARGILLAKNFLQASQYWTESQLQEYQFSRCLSLLEASVLSIPYYKKIFAEYGFEPKRDFKDLSDLKKIPLLSKKLAKEFREQLINPSEVQKSLALSTSGSTGEPFHSFVSHRHWVIEQGVIWRHWGWADYRFRDRMAIIRSYLPKKDEPLWKKDRLRNFYYFSAYHLNPKNADHYLKELIDFQPKFLRGYPSSLFLLAKCLEERCLQLPSVRGIFTASETLLPHYRETIERVFGAKVFDWYGQAEISITMNECDAHDGFHVNSEYGICELLPDSKLPSNQRRVVATCLNNLAMPLIRYDTGDIAIIDEKNDECVCGRTLPKVRSILGRSDELLVSMSGAHIPTINIYTVMSKCKSVHAFQIIQESKNCVRILVASGQFIEADRRHIDTNLRACFGPDVSLDFEINGKFKISGDGKKRAIVANAM